MNSKPRYSKGIYSHYLYKATAVTDLYKHIDREGTWRAVFTVWRGGTVDDVVSNVYLKFDNEEAALDKAQRFIEADHFQHKP